MKKTKRILSVFLCLFVVLGSLSAFAIDLPSSNTNTIDVPYSYPIVPGTPEWKELKTHEEKVAACQIPDDILNSLTTEALIETVANYPLAVDIYAYDSTEQGYLKLKDQFNGVAELERRTKTQNDEVSSVLEKRSQMQSITKDSENFDTIFMQDLYSQLKGVNMLKAAPKFSSSSVRTPNGTSISAYYGLTWSDHNTTQANIEAIDAQFLRTYTSATRVRAGNPSYNCHSYAWYSTSSSNKYWIDDPSSYVLDGSYTHVNTYSVGDKVLYGIAGRSPAHSGIVQTLGEGGRLQKVRSKWGVCGLFDHLSTDCPYPSGVLIYRR